MKCNAAAFGLAVFITLLFLNSWVFGIGIGISPKEMQITSAMRGTGYDRPLSVFNPDDAANNFTLRADGEAGGWLSFYAVEDAGIPITNLAIAGKSKQSLIVKISVPEDEPAGTYNATIYAETVPEGVNKTENAVAAVLVAKTAVIVNVTGEQVVDGIVNTVAIEEDTEPGYPLRIGANFKNTGNVIASPQISVSIQKDGGSVSTFTYAGERVKPEDTRTIFAEWNTTSADSVGDYLAAVSVSLDGRELAAESIPFKVLPVGTLTRQGNFTKLETLDEPALDSAVKLDAYFKNTGRIDTLAKFSGEVYRDGTRVDAISSDELMVETGREAPLVSYLKLSSPGGYTVRGRIVYSGKETETKELSFTVPEKQAEGLATAQVIGESSSGSGIFYAVAGVAALAFGALIVILRRRMS